MRYNIVFHPSWWNKQFQIDFSEPFWFDPEFRIQEDIKMRKGLYDLFYQYGLGEKDPFPRPLIGSDMLACGFLTSMIMGCKVKFFPNDAPQVICAGLDEKAAFDIKKPDFDLNPAWNRIQKQIDYLVNKYGYLESYMDFNGVQNLALDLRGQDLFLDYYDDDSPARHILDVCYETTRETCCRLLRYTGCISGGVSNIVKNVYPNVVLHSNCSIEMISEKDYVNWLLLYDQRLSNEFQPYGIHHCGQSMEHVIRGYNQVNGLRFVEIGAGSDISAVVNALRDDVFMNLRYSPVKLQNATKEEMENDIKSMLNTVSGNRVSISCVGIDSSVNLRQVELFLSICKKYLPE